MEKETDGEEDNVKVHEIKFDEFGIMDDGLDDSTASQLAKLKGGKQEYFPTLTKACVLMGLFERLLCKYL